jgi:hypothetical protein
MPFALSLSKGRLRKVCHVNAFQIAVSIQPIPSNLMAVYYLLFCGIMHPRRDCKTIKPDPFRH